MWFNILGFLIYVFVMAWVSGWRDMVRFVYKETWTRDHLAKWIPYWEASQSSKLDPFHFAGGLMWTLIFILFIINAIWTIAFGVWLITPVPALPDIHWGWFIPMGIAMVMFLWAYFYWARNLIMHVFGVSLEYAETKYINPLWKLFEKGKK